MRRLFFILVVLTLFSCSQENEDTIDFYNDSSAKNLSVVVIDSCEYIQYRTYMYYAITHKGNCKNHKQ